MRVPVAGTVLAEEARSLATGVRVAQRSGYVFQDVRGSTLARTSSDGGAVVTEDAEYDVWGSTVAVSDLAAPEHQFIGAEPDPGVGTYHFGPRTYDPTLRRWLSTDGAVFLAPNSSVRASSDVLNLYGYANNAASTQVDPGGKCPVALAIVLGFAAASAVMVPTHEEGNRVLAAAAVGVTVGGGVAAAGAARTALVLRAAQVAAPAAPLVETALPTAARVAGTLGAAQAKPQVRQAEETVVRRAPDVLVELGEAARTWVDPSTIRFSQDSIGRTFRNGEPLKGAIDALKSGAITPESFPPIRILERAGQTFTLDNRRLFVFQIAEKPISTIPASAEEIAREAFKFTTQNDGTSVVVRGGL